MHQIIFWGFRSGEFSKGGGSKDWESTEKVETYLQTGFKVNLAQNSYSQSKIGGFAPLMAERSLLMSIRSVVNSLIGQVARN